jgi:hypothetical protein
MSLSSLTSLSFPSSSATTITHSTAPVTIPYSSMLSDTPLTSMHLIIIIILLPPASSAWLVSPDEDPPLPRLLPLLLPATAPPPRVRRQFCPSLAGCTSGDDPGVLNAVVHSPGNQIFEICGYSGVVN